VSTRQLNHVLKDCRRTLKDCRNFAADARAWSAPGARPHISRKQHDWIVALAFLRGCLALETFLEESFVLFSLGHTPPKGRAPHRYALPPSRKHVDDWVVPEGRPYATWDANAVSQRASRFFRNGAPFTNALKGSQTALAETRTIRNAIAHDATSVKDRFENLVRTKIGTLPSGLTVGGFLSTIVPASAPPQTFLEMYLARIELVADQIVRS
jgi:hypothetical protein